MVWSLFSSVENVNTIVHFQRLKKATNTSDLFHRGGLNYKMKGWGTSSMKGPIRNMLGFVAI